jgi:hypothetical protein
MLAIPSNPFLKSKYKMQRHLLFLGQRHTDFEHVMREAAVSVDTIAKSRKDVRQFRSLIDTMNRMVAA